MLKHLFILFFRMDAEVRAVSMMHANDYTHMSPAEIISARQRGVKKDVQMNMAMT